MSKTILSKMIYDIYARFTEARIDIKNKGIDGNDMIISDVSDKDYIVHKPAWFSKGGIGYSIKSMAGIIRFSVTVIKDGTLNIFLHTEPCFSINDKKSKVPIWLDYDFLSINDKMIFSEQKATWHDRPFTLDMPVKDGESITFEVAWHPHVLESMALDNTLEQLCAVYMSKLMPPPQCT